MAVYRLLVSIRGTSGVGYGRHSVDCEFDADDLRIAMTRLLEVPWRFRGWGRTKRQEDECLRARAQKSALNSPHLGANLSTVRTPIPILVCGTQFWG